MARDFWPAPICASAFGPSKTSKTRDVLDERLVGGAGGLEDGVGLGPGVEDEGEVALDGLEVGGVERRAGGAAGAGLGEGVEVEGEGDGGAFHVEGGEDARVELAEGWRAGSCGRARGWRSGRGGTRPGAVRWRMREAGAPMAASAASASARASQRSTGRRLPCGLRGAVAPVRRPAAWSDCSPGSPPGKAWPISKRARSADAAGLVAGGGAQEAGEEVGAEVAHLGGDGVLEPHGLGGAAEEGGGGGVDEGVGDGLVQPRVAMRRRTWPSRRWAGVRMGCATPAGRVRGRPSSLARARRRGRSPRRGRPRPGRRGARSGGWRRGRRG